MKLRTAALGLVLLTFGTPVSADPSKPSPPANPHRPAFVADRGTEQGTSLYSPRARRLMRAYLRLRLLELRERDLDRVRTVVERRLGVDALLTDRETRAGATEYKPRQP